jgi:hypothetical protein
MHNDSGLISKVYFRSKLLTAVRECEEKKAGMLAGQLFHVGQ